MKVVLIALTIKMALLTTGTFATEQHLEVEQKILSAIKSYEEGNFNQAIELYEQIIGDGLINGHVYYNLGNAYYRSGQKGHAVAAYLMARRYLPHDPDVKANLEFVLKTIQDKLEVKSPKPLWGMMLFWIDHFTLRQLLYGSTYMFGIAMLLMIIAVFVKTKLWLKPVALATLVLSLMMAVGHLGKYVLDLPWGAVIQDEAKVYSGPNSQVNSVLFKLHQGAPFALEDSERGWYQIILSDGKKGWIEQGASKIYL